MSAFIHLPSRSCDIRLDRVFGVIGVNIVCSLEDDYLLVLLLVILGIISIVDSLLSLSCYCYRCYNCRHINVFFFFVFVFWLFSKQVYKYSRA